MQQRNGTTGNATKACLPWQHCMQPRLEQAGGQHRHSTSCSTRTEQRGHQGATGRSCSKWHSRACLATRQGQQPTLPRMPSDSVVTRRLGREPPDESRPCLLSYSLTYTYVRRRRHTHVHTQHCRAAPTSPHSPAPTRLMSTAPVRREGTAPRQTPAVAGGNNSRCKPHQPDSGRTSVGQRTRVPAARHYSVPGTHKHTPSGSLAAAAPVTEHHQAPTAAHRCTPQHAQHTPHLAKQQTSCAPASWTDGRVLLPQCMHWTLGEEACMAWQAAPALSVGAV